VRKILLSTASLLAIAGAGIAQAADLPRSAPPPVYSPVAAANWTGFYAGIHGGGGWADSQSTFLSGAPSPADFNLSGPYIGAQIGYNWQFANNWLLGVEADANWSGIHGTRATSVTTVQNIDWFGSVRARLGWVNGDWMPYVTGGWAWAGGSRTSSSIPQTVTATHNGWTVGVGAEWAFAQNWTMKAEYKYFDLGSASYNFSANPSSVNIKMHTVELGVNYKF
jgi:opacity protein-like surface antigen